MLDEFGVGSGRIRGVVRWAYRAILKRRSFVSRPIVEGELGGGGRGRSRIGSSNALT